MEPVFKTTIKYTLDEIKKYQKAVFINKKFIIIFLLTMACLIYTGIKNFIFMILAIIFPIFCYLLYKKSTKVLLSNKLLYNKDINYEFYETYFVRKCEVGETKVDYSKLYKIIETKRNIYLMIAKNQGFLLLKDNFPEGLDKFLQNIFTKSKNMV